MGKKGKTKRRNTWGKRGKRWWKKTGRTKEEQSGKKV